MMNLTALMITSVPVFTLAKYNVLLTRLIGF